MPKNASEYQNEYMKAYNKENIRQVRIPFNQRNEDDKALWEWLEGMESKQTYIKNLIRQDMKERNVEMITVFEGYTGSNKKIHAELNPDTGVLYIVYEQSGRRIRHNEEHYTEESDFGFLLNDFRKA